MMLRDRYCYNNSVILETYDSRIEPQTGDTVVIEDQEYIVEGRRIYPKENTTAYMLKHREE